MYPLNHIKLPTVQGNWVSELTNRVHHICLIKVSFESDLSTSISLQPCLEFLYCRFVFEIVVRYTSEQIIAHFLLPHPRQGEDILWNLLKSNKWASLFSKNLKLIDTFHSFNNKTMLTFSSIFFSFCCFVQISRQDLDVKGGYLQNSSWFPSRQSWPRFWKLSVSWREVLLKPQGCCKEC